MTGMGKYHDGDNQLDGEDFTFKKPNYHDDEALLWKHSNSVCTSILQIFEIKIILNL